MLRHSVHQSARFKATMDFSSSALEGLPTICYASR